MATTVIQAFEQFLSDTVNLDSGQTTKARASRDWLLQQVALFPDHYDDFPPLHSDFNLAFGSFARRTKIRPLDDIDQIVGIAANGATYVDYGGRVELTLPYGTQSNLGKYLHDGTQKLNSRKIVNAFVIAAQDVPQYADADIGRNGEAAIVNLASYSWSFDVVPAFFTTPEFDGRTYYIIPDGEGHWKKTDPRMDHDRVSRENVKHDGNMLNVLRTMKYWNSRKTAPAAPSYMFENLILNYSEAHSGKMSGFVDIELPNVFRYISQAIYNHVRDAKGVEGNLNTLDLPTQIKISARAADDAKLAERALQFERDDDIESSINTWRKIFGPDFPTFG